MRTTAGVWGRRAPEFLYMVTQIQDQPLTGAASRLRSRRELGDPQSKHEIGGPAFDAGLRRSSIVRWTRIENSGKAHRQALGVDRGDGSRTARVQSFSCRVNCLFGYMLRG